MRPKRNFDADLLQELKLFTHCKKKAKNPNHYCTQRELSKNLKMSLRDVGKNLSKMVTKGIIIHEGYTNENHVIADKFYPARRFNDKEVMRPIQMNLKNQLKIMKDLASKMRENPAYQHIKMLNMMGKSNKEILRDLPERLGYVKNKEGIFVSKSSSGKINPKGYQIMQQFCNYAIDTFSTVDSLAYALSEKTLTDNQVNEKIIYDLRMQTYNEIHDLVEYSIRPFNARLQNEIRSHIYMSVKQLFLINEMRKLTEIKT